MGWGKEGTERDVGLRLRRKAIEEVEKTEGREDTGEVHSYAGPGTLDMGREVSGRNGRPCDFNVQIPRGEVA